MEQRDAAQPFWHHRGAGPLCTILESEVLGFTWLRRGSAKTDSIPLWRPVGDLAGVLPKSKQTLLSDKGTLRIFQHSLFTGLYTCCLSEDILGKNDIVGNGAGFWHMLSHQRGKRHSCFVVDFKGTLIPKKQRQKGTAEEAHPPTPFGVPFPEPDRSAVPGQEAAPESSRCNP